MGRETPRPGKGAGLGDSVTGLTDPNPSPAPNQESSPRARAPSPALDLVSFRERLVAARARLVERIILEYNPERPYPDTAWTRMVSDLHITIMAVDDMIAEGGP